MHKGCKEQIAGKVHLFAPLRLGVNVRVGGLVAVAVYGWCMYLVCLRVESCGCISTRKGCSCGDGWEWVFEQEMLVQGGKDGRW